MNIEIKHFDKKIVIPSPKNYIELLNQIQKLFYINKKNINSINIFYLDDDSEENIISCDEDLSIFKELLDTKQAFNSIYNYLRDLNTPSDCIFIKKNFLKKIIIVSPT